jgi:sodium-dependent phosphate cotransporter
MIVAMVASGSLDIYGAIPMLMGANIGTTLTSNIVALSFITRRSAFRRAVSAATMHDHFNILTTIILFPLQYYYNFLGSASTKVAQWLSVEHGAPHADGMPPIVPHSSFISEHVVALVGNYVLVLVFAVVLLFVSIKLFSRVIYRLLVGTARINFAQFIFSNPYKSFGWGAAITAAIQSSSVTSSLIVPVVATRKVDVANAFPFILGANVGTTITALLAAVFNTETAVAIAIAHLLFNLIGVMIFMPFPLLRSIPVRMGIFLGNMVERYRMIGILYIIITFFLIPFAFIYLSR